MTLFKKKKIAPRSSVDKSRLLDNNSSFVVKETYKSLRTNLMFSLQNLEQDGKAIIFSSALPGEGKTTVCLNTAITFAQTGAKVIVIDADLRIPKLHKYFDLNGKNGLSNVLGGFSNYKDAIVHHDTYNIDIIPGGHIPPNPAELLSSKAMTDLIEQLKKEYDFILIDTPPITVVTDAVVFSHSCSGVVLVIRERYTPHAAIKEVLKTLKFANAKVLGFINNCSKMSEISYKGGYGSKRVYKKYSGYSKYTSYGYGYGARSLEENKKN